MARNIYGASGAAQVVSLTGTPTLASATVKTARTGGITVTDIQNMANANLGGVVAPDSRGQIIFQGPDNSTATYWLDFGDGGPRWAISPVDFTTMMTGAMVARETAQNIAPGAVTAKAALPYVDNTAFENLALALDPLVIKRFATSGTRDTAFPAPADGDRCYRTDLHAHQTYRTGIGTAARWVTDPALIAEYVLGIDAATISFQNIPQEWRHLSIKFRTRAVGSNAANVNTQPIGIRFNNDTGNNYSCLGYIRNLKIVTDAGGVTTRTFELAANGTGGNVSATAASFGAAVGGLSNYGNGIQSSAHVAVCAGSAFTTLHGGGEIKIDDYVNATVRKSFEGQSGYNDGTGYTVSTTGFSSFSVLRGGWASNAAITRIDLLPILATSFVAGSRFSLYGHS